MSIGQSYVLREQSKHVAKFHDTGFWARLIEALNDAGYRENYQTTVTKLIDIKQPSVHEWEKGISMPSMANVVRLAIELNADVQYLYTGKRSRYSIPRNDREAIELWKIWHRLPPATRGRLLGIAEGSLGPPPADPDDSAEELQRRPG